jgi:hypothetical protein
MIPSEVAAIADLICLNWPNLDEIGRAEVIQAAYRVYEAGYRIPETADA